MKLQLQRDKREADAFLISCYVGSLGIPSYADIWNLQISTRRTVAGIHR